MTSGFKAHGTLAALSAIVLLAAGGSAWPGAAAAADRSAGTSQPARVVQPPGRAWASLAYDQRLHELVLFGGDTELAGHPGVVFRGTWTRTGATWTKRHPARSPSARTGAAMVYDAAAGQLLLFGGSGNADPFQTDGSLNAETWIWTGRTWRELHPAVSPPARRGADMVYDAARREVILYGGYDGSAMNDTWAWNGATWTQLHPALSPGWRFDQAMAYDGATRKVILFGGYNLYGDLSNDTWSWDGTTWTLLHPAVHPRLNAPGWEAAYDPATRQLLLLGRDLGIRTPKNEIWIWTGATWRQFWPRVVPRDRDAGSMTYDSAIRKIVLFGGADGGCSTVCQHTHYPTSTLIWNGKVWQSR